MKPTDIRARILAVIVGIALWFLLAFALEDRLTNHTLLIGFLIFFAFYIASYSFAGLLFGLAWPNSGWRLGLYLMAVWPPIVVAWFVLTDPPPVINWREEIRYAILYQFGILLNLAGAMAGAWAGSLIRRRMIGARSIGANDSLP